MDTARVNPGLKQLLEYSVRRKRWQDWYKDHPLLQLLVRPFWGMSDYGRSTGWIIFWFFALAIAFAIVYYCVRGTVAHLHETGHVVSDLLRACYFSIVTMTTLGFGDMHADSQSWLGHVLLTIQVLLGYVLLAALVTRFAVLFTAGGPAGSWVGQGSSGNGPENRSKPSA